MRIIADRHNRALLLSVSAVLIIYALLLFCGCGLSVFLCVVSTAAFAAVILLLVCYLKGQDRLIENAAKSVESFLSGQHDERIECDSEGELYYFFSKVNTLSSVLNAKSEREKQTNEYLRSTVSDISHQIKTPLSALGLYTELIADADKLEDARRFASSADAEIERMDTLMKDLLNLTRMDAGAILFERRPENIADIMDELSRRFSCRAQLEMKELRFAGGDDVLSCDAHWLTEAFGNLIKNALDHTSEGDCVSVEWARRGNILNVTFKDNGSGIHPEDIGHIFKRFYRSRFSKDTQGAGLGLPLARSIIEAHDGMIEVESELGRGTVFIVNFPIPTES